MLTFFVFLFLMRLTKLRVFTDSPSARPSSGVLKFTSILIGPLPPKEMASWRFPCSSGLILGNRGRSASAIAWMIADALRPRFPSISPDEHGKRHEAISFGGKGPIKIDVNFSTPELGLALGLSVKTLNFVNLIKNKKTKKVSIGRYGKNYTRIDKELRAEAKD